MKTLVTIISLIAVLVGYHVTAQAATQKTSIDYNYQKKAITVHFSSKKGQHYRLVDARSGRYETLKAGKGDAAAVSLKFRGYPNFKLEKFTDNKWIQMKIIRSKAYTTPKFSTHMLAFGDVNFGLNQKVAVPTHTKITVRFKGKIRKIIQTHDSHTKWIKVETHKNMVRELPIEYTDLPLTVHTAFLITQKTRNRKTSAIRMIRAQVADPNIARA